MDWITGIQNAIDYMEDHMTEETNLKRIAEKAACSPFYFQRIFGILCGISLGEYLRNRRLTLAGSELACSGAKVIDVALKYGYDSPESFTRAFTRFHGITPSEAKKDGRKLRSFSKVSVQIILKGGSMMNYRIVKKDAFCVLEKAEMHSVEDSQNLNTIPEFWSRAHRDGTVETLLKQTPDSSYIFGVCYDNAGTDSKTFEYSIAALYGGGAIPDGYRIHEMPAHTWAIFECKGAMPDAIQQAWHQICSEFFPTSQYQPTYELNMEAYPDGDMTSAEYRSEIWIPLKNQS